jgi:8-amino-7-oxononanoate synthase
MPPSDFAPHPAPSFEGHLAELAQADQLRTRRVVTSPVGRVLETGGRTLINFASNDYLGLANHPRIAAAAKNAIDEFGVGAGASHMVSGHMAPHHALETELAQFTGMPRALFFSSGYAANLGMVTALASRGDAIFADKLNHACLNDGARLSRADFKRYAHGDLGKLRLQLADHAKNAANAARRMVITDAVFSMDGDIADIRTLIDLCDEFDALLLIDDAHGFGVLGARGRGTLEHLRVQSPRIVYMATLGKAAGVYGAFVAGSEDTIEWILQTARTYLFSTATPPMIAAALRESLKMIDDDHARRAHLHELIARFSNSLKLKCSRLPPSQTAIQPIIVGDNSSALHMARELQARGMWVPAIRPPTVPRGTARLRVSLSAAHTIDDVMNLIVALSDIDANLDRPSV